MGGTTQVAERGSLARPASIGARRRASFFDRHFARIAVLPTTLLMLVVFGIPLLFSAWLSFEGWAPDQTLFGGTFAGLANYQDLVTDPEFTGSLILTLEYTAGVVAAELAVGLGIALLLNIDLPWIGLFRTCLIVPMMITPVVAAFCWKLLLDPDHGVINFFIQQHIVWLGRPDTALVSVAVVNVWQNAPYVAILLLAGLRSLPHEPIEAAQIDGASRLQMFRHITLPLLRP
ncbi:MAG TPA: sugar ABC transporter permease, partial [Rhodopila sp.]